MRILQNLQHCGIPIFLSFVLFQPIFFFYFVMYYQTQNSKKAFYICVGLQVVVVLIAMLFYFIVKLIYFLYLIYWEFTGHSTTDKRCNGRGYFVTALVYTLWMLRVGLPERPLDIQIDNSTVVIGENKSLLSFSRRLYLLR